MRISKRFLFVMLGVAVLFGTASFFSGSAAIGKSNGIPLLSGNWAGTGTGEYHPPGQIIYPFQSWSGLIQDDLVTFKGTWSDSSGNYGTCKGKLTYTGLTTAYCKSQWTWDNAPNGPVNLGKFKIDFDATTSACSGIWTSVPPYASGTITGSKVK